MKSSYFKKTRKKGIFLAPRIASELSRWVLSISLRWIRGYCSVSFCFMRSRSSLRSLTKNKNLRHDSRKLIASKFIEPT